MEITLFAYGGGTCGVGTPSPQTFNAISRTISIDPLEFDHEQRVCVRLNAASNGNIGSADNQFDFILNYYGSVPTITFNAGEQIQLKSNVPLQAKLNIQMDGDETCTFNTPTCTVGGASCQKLINGSPVLIPVTIERTVFDTRLEEYRMERYL